MQTKSFPPLSPQARGFLLNLLAWMPYLLYVGFVIAIDQGPVDYETFMGIGGRWLAGQPVYGVVNSYYPMPAVLIFGLFRLLPRPLSLGLWLLLPALAAWLIAGRRPWVLLFGPLFAHVAGGQSAGLALLGLWGYRRSRQPEDWRGGLWLALLAFKPQLALLPLAAAGWEWLGFLRRRRGIPPQALSWAAGMLAWWLAGELTLPGWVGQWLGGPRPLFERALAGILPRGLVVLGLEGNPVLFWGLLGLGGLAVLLMAWAWNRRRLTFDLWLLLGATFNPLEHDYDLVQLIPLLDTPLLRRWAVLASLPLWLVILLAYQNDQAWFVVTLIPPVLAIAALWEDKHRPLPQPLP
jgi:hypothetical protein